MYQTLKKHKGFTLVAGAVLLGIFLYTGIIELNYTNLVDFFKSDDPLDVMFRWVLQGYVGGLIAIKKDWMAEKYTAYKDKKKNGK